jgi:sterol desaturase/sphingolipid hydroxylase (fatty acid hydroxylase superfamily)
MINALMVSLVFVSLWAWVTDGAQRHSWGLLNLVHLPDDVHALGVILMLDLWTYLWHLLNHRVPFFWRFHRVHHSDRKMDVTTASRFHFGEIFLSSSLRLPVLLLVGARLWELMWYETLMFATVQFHHANVGLPEKWDRLLRMLMVTPAVHKVHHSCEKEDYDSNFSSLFTFWDRLGRTFRLKDARHIIFGLSDASSQDENMKGILTEPFRP